MNEDCKLKIEKLGWEVTQEYNEFGVLMYIAVKGSKLAMSCDISKLYEGCRMMDKIITTAQVEIDPFKDMVVREPPLTEKKKKMLDYFKFKLIKKDGNYVNKKIKIGISVSDVNTLSDQRLFRTLDALSKADKIPEEEFVQLIRNTIITR